MQMDIETYEQHLINQGTVERAQRDAGSAIPYHGPSLGLSFTPLSPLDKEMVNFNNTRVLKVPFTAVAVDLANGKITNVEYPPSLQQHAYNKDRYVNLEPLGRMTLMLLFTHINGKKYMSKAIYNASTNQLFPPV